MLALDLNDEVWPIAERIAAGLAEAGVETLLDDRKERPGVKFAEADLMGFPYQVVVGRRGVRNGIAELKDRSTGERSEVPLESVVSLVAELVRERRR